jgi:hypothetical protein
MKNALSIDVEDYFHVSGFEDVIDPDKWDEYPVRFQIGMGKILSVLGRHDVKATFFFLGWIADPYPETVADVARRGHEIAIHGYAHRLIYRQRPDEFAEDLARAGRRTQDLRRSDSGLPGANLLDPRRHALGARDHQGLRLSLRFQHSARQAQALWHRRCAGFAL